MHRGQMRRVVEAEQNLLKLFSGIHAVGEVRTVFLTVALGPLCDPPCFCRIATTQHRSDFKFSECLPR